MKSIIQLIVGTMSILGTLVTLFLLATSEMNFMDEKFTTYFGILSILAAITFFVLTRNDDNEETNPGKEKRR